MHTVILNEQKSPSVSKMIVEAPYIAKHRKPGQFVILRVDEVGERFPLTIVDSDSDKGTITLFYQVVGTSTDKLSRLKAGEYVMDIAGPLGHATEIVNFGTAVCVGGGIGIAADFPIAVGMKKAGNRVVNIIGSRTENLLILEDELRDLGDELIVCTDDGSRGKKAFVTDALKEVIEREKVDIVVAIGPVPMMAAVSKLTKEYGIKTIVSLNSIMVDGTGMCGGCRVSVDGEKKFTCVDGPEFDGHQVDFGELMSRLKTYNAEEQKSYEQHKHQCKLHGVLNNG